MSTNEIVLLNVDDIQKITGWSPAVIQKTMSRPDFPAIKIGKQNQVLLESFKEYLKPGRILRGEI